MSSIRPLATITLLAVIGVFLYVKINEGPVLHDSLQAERGSLPQQDGAPPFAPGPSSPSPTGSAPLFGAPESTAAAAPDGSVAWSPPPVSGNLTVPTSSDSPSFASEAVAPTQQPTNPAQQQAIPAQQPAIPTVPALPDAGGQAMSAEVPEFPPLPQNVPTANYDSATVEDATTPAIGSGPSFDFGSPAPQAASETAPPAVHVSGAAGAPPATTAADDLTQDFPAIPSASSEAASAATPEVVGNPATLASSPATSVYEMTKPNIQASLDEGDLPQAHLLLSSLLREPTLNESERREVRALLSQLAGSVIYSQEHYLEPECVVGTGETLETIASRYRVPWQLLAKINGIPRVDGVAPGDKLKVVQGPFEASVLLSDREMMLDLAGRYAGQFAVAVASPASVGEGDWVVVSKALQPTGDEVTPVNSPSPAAGPGFEKQIVLRNTSNAAESQLTIGASPSPLESGAAHHEIELAARDMDDLYDILTVGSRVTIKR